MRNKVPPLVDPRVCTDDELREIIETDPNANPDYQKELDRRERHQAEVHHYEKKLLQNGRVTTMRVPGDGREFMNG